MKLASHPATDELSLVEVLRALGDPVRLGVVRSLAEGERACGTLAVPVCKSTMSHHVRVLREGGLIGVRQDGTRSILSLRREDLEARFPGLLDAILRHADGVTASGDE
ncbi:MAG: ArsR/SmtB family transcription factor [Fimbriimonas sp.]